MKVFDGNKFLDTNKTELQLSNGFKTVVREIPGEAMAKIAKIQKAEDETVFDGLKSVLATICEAEISDFDGLGMIELRGAIDFLLENLFTTPSQK